MSKAKIDLLNKINSFENPQELTNDELNQLKTLSNHLDKDPNYLADLPTVVLDQFMKALELHIGGFIAQYDSKQSLDPKHDFLLELFETIGNKLKGKGLNYEDILNGDVFLNIKNNYLKKKESLLKQSKKDLGKLFEEVVLSNNQEFVDRLEKYLSHLTTLNGEFLVADKKSNPKIIFKDKKSKKQFTIVDNLPKYSSNGLIDGVDSNNEFLIGNSFSSINQELLNRTNQIVGSNVLDLKVAVNPKLLKSQGKSLGNGKSESILPKKSKLGTLDKPKVSVSPSGFTYANGSFFVRGASGLNTNVSKSPQLEIPGSKKDSIKKSNAQEVTLDNASLSVGNTDNESYSIEFKAKSEKIADKQVQVLGAYIKKIIEIGNKKGGVYLDFETGLQGKQYQKLLGGVIVDLGTKTRLNLSAQDLHKLERLNFSKSGEVREFLAHQFTAGFELNYWLGSFINKLSLAGIYGKSDNKSFGVLGGTLTETPEYAIQKEIRGFFQGATTYEGKVSMDFKLAEWLKLESSLGLQHLKYNNLGTDAMGMDIETDDNSKTGLTYGARLTGQFSDRKTEAYLGIEHDLKGNDYKAGVSRYLTKGVKLGVEGGYNEPLETGRDPEWKIAAMISWVFGGEEERHSKLFQDPKSRKKYLDDNKEDEDESYSNMPELGLRDLKSVPGVDTKRIAGRAWEHEITTVIDKTKGFTYEKDDKGLIKIIKMAGSPNLIPGDHPLSTNPSGLSDLFYVTPDKSVGITYKNALELFKRTNGTPVIMNFRETGGTNYVLDVTISIGSMHFDQALSIGGLNPDFAKEIVNRKVHPKILQGVLDGILLPATGNDMHFVQGYFDSGIVSNYLNGHFSARVMNAVQQGRYPSDRLVNISNGSIDNPTAEAYLDSNPPTLEIDDSVSTNESTPIVINYTVSDPNGDEVTVSIQGNPAHGTLSHNSGTKQLTYTPNSGYFGADSFVLQYTDGINTLTKTISLNVIEVNDQPVATLVPDQNSISGQPFSINVSSYIQDPEGLPLSFSISDQPDGLTINPTTGLISGTPVITGGITNYTITITGTEIRTDGKPALSAQTSMNLNLSEAIDTSPNAFAFLDVSGAELNTVYTETITIQGINSPTSVSIEGGEYSINGGAYTSDVGTVNNGDTITIRLTSSGLHSTNTSSKLTVGDRFDTFDITTKDEAIDTVPNQFTFTDVESVPLSTEQVSNEVTITGLTGPSNVTITDGEYSIDGGPWSSDPTTISNNQKIKVRHTSTSSYNSFFNTYLDIGGVTDTFSSKTIEQDLVPDAFNFNSISNAGLNTVVTSNEVTLTGFNSPTSISIMGGDYSINGGAFTNTVGTVNPGDKLIVRLTTGNVEGETSAVLVTVGGYIGDFEVTTLSGAPTLTFNNKTSTGDSISVDINSDKQGNGYYILSTSSTPMNPVDIKNNGTSIGLNSGSNPLTINNVNSDTNYYLHFVAENTGPSPVLGTTNTIDFLTGTFTGEIVSNSGTLYKVYENKDVNFNLDGPGLANFMISFNDGGSQATGGSLQNAGKTVNFNEVFLTRISNIRATITGQTYSGNTVKYYVDVPDTLAYNRVDPVRSNTSSSVLSGESTTWNVTHHYVVDGVNQADDPNREGLAFINGDTIQPSQGNITVTSDGQVTFDATGVGAGTYTATLHAVSYTGSIAEVNDDYYVTVTVEVQGVDNEPPLAPTGMVVNGGASYVNDPFIVVDVNHSNPSDVAAYYVSESNTPPAVDNPDWSSSNSILLNLSEPDGAKTLYAFVKDANGNIQNTPATISVNLDRVPLSTLDWVEGVSDQNTFYSARVIQADGQIGTANLTSLFGGDITNVNIVGNQITFDYRTPNIEEDIIRVQITDLAGNPSTLELATGIIF